MILVVIFLQTHTLTSLAFALWLLHNRGHCIKVAVSIFMKQNRTNFHVNSMMLANRTPNRMLNEHHPPTKKPHNLRWRRRRRRARRSNSMMCARVSMRRRNKAAAELKYLNYFGKGLLWTRLWVAITISPISQIHCKPWIKGTSLSDPVVLKLLRACAASLTRPYTLFI